MLAIQNQYLHGKSLNGGSSNDVFSLQGQNRAGLQDQEHFSSERFCWADSETAASKKRVCQQ